MWPTRFTRLLHRWSRDVDVRTILGDPNIVRFTERFGLREYQELLARIPNITPEEAASLRSQATKLQEPLEEHCRQGGVGLRPAREPPEETFRSPTGVKDPDRGT